VPNPPNPTGGPPSDAGDPDRGWVAEQATPQATGQYREQSDHYRSDVTEWGDQVASQEMPQATPQSNFPGTSPKPGGTGRIHKGP